MSMTSKILVFIPKQVDLTLQLMASCELQTVQIQQKEKPKLTCKIHFLTLIIIQACFILQELK